MVLEVNIDLIGVLIT